jgi:ketol-acid reductoisomerase
MKIGMLGYGAQGRAEALNLRKSEVSFMIGLREGGASYKKAQEDGFEPKTMKEVVEASDLIFMNLPDQVQAEVYKELISGSDPKYLVFAHGFNTHFKYIPVESSGPKHILIAPKGAASGLERLYKTEDALPAVLAFLSAEGNTPDANRVCGLSSTVFDLG